MVFYLVRFLFVIVYIILIDPNGVTKTDLKCPALDKFNGND